MFLSAFSLPPPSAVVRNFESWSLELEDQHPLPVLCYSFVSLKCAKICVIIWFTEVKMLRVADSHDACQLSVLYFCLLSQVRCWSRWSGLISNRSTPLCLTTTPYLTTSTIWTPRRPGEGHFTPTLLTLSILHTSHASCSVSSVLLQRRNCLQEHDDSIRLGQAAYAGEDRPDPSWHSHFLHLRITLQHRQRLRIRHQENEAGCWNHGQFFVSLFIKRLRLN